MLRTLIEARALVVLIVAAATGLWGTQTYPVSRDDVFLGLIAETRARRVAFTNDNPYSEWSLGA